MKVNFGKYEDWSLYNIPDSYLVWAIENKVGPEQQPDFYQIAEEELDKRMTGGYLINDGGDREYF